MSDDSDDDLLLENTGLGTRCSSRLDTKKRKREQLLNLVEEDLQHRQLRGGHLRDKLLNDSHNVVEQAEENLAIATEREKVKATERNDNNSNEQECERQMLIAQETSGYDKLGTRNGCWIVCHLKREVVIESIIRRTQDNHLKKYLQEHLDRGLLSIALECGNLGHRFDLQSDLIHWMWRCAITLTSEYADGSFLTLRDYYQHKKPPFASLKGMKAQWKYWFQRIQLSPDPQNYIEEENRPRQTLDISRWLQLWVVLLKNAKIIDEADTAHISFIIESLSIIPVYNISYRYDHKQLSSAWISCISLLLDTLRKKLDEAEWKEWTIKTSRIINSIRIEPPQNGSEDFDDIQCSLSRVLIARSFAATNFNFARQHYILTLQHVLDVEDWDTTIPKYLTADDGWMLKKYQETDCTSWEPLLCTICAFPILERKVHEASINPPQILACMKLIQDCASNGLFEHNESENIGRSESDFAKWLCLLEEKVIVLNKFVLRSSSHGHFRRIEVCLSFIKSWINAYKTITFTQEAIQIQSNITSWLEKKTHDPKEAKQCTASPNGKKSC